MLLPQIDYFDAVGTSYKVFGGLFQREFPYTEILTNAAEWCNVGLSHLCWCCVGFLFLRMIFMNLKFITDIIGDVIDFMVTHTEPFFRAFFALMCCWLCCYRADFRLFHWKG